MSLFIIIALLIYSSINGYILWHIRSTLLHLHWPGQPFAWIIVFLMLAYPLGRIVESFYKCPPSSILIYLGAYYLGFMILLFTGYLIGDLFRLISFALPKSIFQNVWGTAFGNYWRVAVFILAFMGVIMGHFNARVLRIRSYDLTINKALKSVESLNVVMASDIHLGTIINTNRLQKIVDTINSLKPDIVLLVGDVVDEDVDKLIEHDMSPVLAQIKTTRGMFAVTGNHEYISGNPQTAVKYLEEAGVKMLQDEIALIDDQLYIVGRVDRSALQFTGVKRLRLTDLISPLDSSKPIILMDHQPFNLSEAMENGVDLQVSGHTHHGQIWPLNYITEKIYERSWGYLRKGDTQYYVSSGAGTWGPPIRLGNVPEIVQLTLHFSQLRSNE